MVLSYLGEMRLAELVINQREQCRHDRTPLFDQCGKFDWQLFQGSFAARQKWLLHRGKLFRSEHAKKISSRVRGDPLQAGGTLRREDALVYRAGLLNKTGPVEVTLRDKLNNFAHLLTKVGKSRKYSANDIVRNSWFQVFRFGRPALITSSFFRTAGPL